MKHWQDGLKTLRLISKRGGNKVVYMKRKNNPWLNGIMGVVIGDALGMPVQFLSRKEVLESPITGMRGYGTYNMPPGTWSDDSSMTLATLHSIRKKKGIDYDDIMCRFLAWTMKGKYTPAGEAFDQGCTCVEAMTNYLTGKDYMNCGKTGEWANGNGALMRIIPVCLYCYVEHKKGNVTLEEAIGYIHQVSALTHNHLRSKMACGIYFFLVRAILDESGSLTLKLQKGIKDAEIYYKSDIKNLKEYAHFVRLGNLLTFAQCSENEIYSSGYVVDSLEAAIWSLITTESFEDGLLKAVNLGGDTDTVGAIAGGLASLHYGYNNIPVEWLDAIIGKDDIVSLCEEMEVEFHV